MDDEDESEQSERLGPAGSPDRAQVRLCHIGLRLMPWMVADWSLLAGLPLENQNVLLPTKYMA